jgi:hypothetical protein
LLLAVMRLVILWLQVAVQVQVVVHQAAVALAVY